METLAKVIGGTIIIGVLVAGILALLMALPVMLLWNALLPALFDLPTIDFWQAFGLALLCRFLVGTSSSSNDKTK